MILPEWETLCERNKSLDSIQFHTFNVQMMILMQKCLILQVTHQSFLIIIMIIMNIQVIENVMILKILIELINNDINNEIIDNNIIKENEQSVII